MCTHCVIRQDVASTHPLLTSLILPFWALLLFRGRLLAVLGRGLDWARVIRTVPLPIVSMEGRSWQISLGWLTCLPLPSCPSSLCLVLGRSFPVSLAEV